MNKKELLVFFKKALKTHTLHVAAYGDDLLIADGAGMFRVPFPGKEWSAFYWPDMNGATLRIQPGGHPEPCEKPDAMKLWQSFEKKSVICELAVTEEGFFTGEDHNYEYLSPWACKCAAPEGFFLVNYNYLALLDPSLPYHLRAKANDWKLEVLEDWVVRASERVVWNKANGQREEKYMPVGYIMPIKAAAGLRMDGPYFKPGEEEVA